jgi:allantoin racemase
MRRLLIINPNTNAAITERIATWAQARIPEDVQINIMTARFGAPYISCEASHLLAGHALLDAWANYLDRCEEAPDGVLIACFGDPGLFALREVSACPVTGLAEASFHRALDYGKFAIVTGGDRWKPILERLAASLELGAGLVHIEIVNQTGAQLMADQEFALTVLHRACSEAIQKGVDSVILGGAGLLGFAQRLQPRFNIPIIDSVQAGLDIYLQNRMPPARQSMNAFHTNWLGLPAAMNRSKNRDIK